MLEPPFRGHGRVASAGLDLPDLPYVRLTQRRAPPRDRRSLWMLLAVALAFHVLLAWLAWLVLRPHPLPPATTAVSVTLIEPESALPPPPPLVAPPPLPGQPPPPAPPRRHVAPAPGAISATLEDAQGKALHLYQPNGQVRLPSAGQEQESVPEFETPALKGAPVLTIKSPVKYKPTRFNQDWAPLDESLGAKTIGRAFDKVVEKTTAVKTVRLPGGIKFKCGVSPLVLFLGCGGEPPPTAPSERQENDVRLSMPPAQTLTGKKVSVPSSASSAPPPAPGSH